MVNSRPPESLRVFSGVCPAVRESDSGISLDPRSVGFLGARLRGASLRQKVRRKNADRSLKVLHFRMDFDYSREGRLNLVTEHRFQLCFGSAGGARLRGATLVSQKH